jgi:hypothetical protein
MSAALGFLPSPRAGTPSKAVWSASPSPCAARQSPISNSAPRTDTGIYNVLPATSSRLSSGPALAPRRCCDSRPELRSHGLAVELHDLLRNCLIAIRRNEAAATVVGVVDGEINGKDFHFQRFARLGAFNVHRSRQDMPPQGRAGGERRQALPRLSSQ